MVASREAPRGDETGSPAHEAAPGPSSPDFPVVGIGASAGGVQALLRFFENAPADMNMAFAVVLHLSPKHESLADQVLQRVTQMPVIQVTSETHIRKNHIYVISPAKDLAMRDGMLSASDASHARGRPVSIDRFFRSLADAHGERAISIVMSGSGSDGAVGIGRIKEQLGITLVQSPLDAEYPEMPQSAIETGMVDFVLPAVEMPQKLIELWRIAQAIELSDKDANTDEPVIASTGSLHGTPVIERALSGILKQLRVRTGHDFSHYKRATVLRRIERRMQVSALTTLPDYLDYLTGQPEEAQALLRDMLIGVTHFFRDREAFEALEREIVPALFEGRAAEDKIRVWAAGCSTGEEAYSLAMLLAEQQAERATELHHEVPPFQVFATDIDERSIMAGRKGLYPTSIITDVPPARLRQFFIREPLHYRVVKPLRERLLFAQHNVLRDPPFSSVDLVSCRNMLIYLDRDAQRQVLQLFHFALRPGGVLFLGTSESAEVANELFIAIDKKNRIFRARPSARKVHPQPTVPVPPATQAPLALLGVVLPQLPGRVSFAAVHQRALTQCGPASVVVDHASDIVHMSDQVGRFLRFTGGEPSQNIVDIVLPELRLELRTALFQATQSRRSVDARRVRIVTDSSTRYVNMTVRPYHDDIANADFVLVLFSEVDDAPASLAGDAAPVAADPLVAQLEDELRGTRAQLQATIEHADASTEELKASNEELQAINEELRSATEELETSKEELQSTNEELSTVNGELRARIDDANKANDDLQNLISSTEIATIFVDRAMRIKRFTPKAVDLFNLIPSDLGRPLFDITHRLDYPQLAADVAATIDSLQVTEREVHGINGAVFLSRMLPYRTADHRIDGVVMTLIDISARLDAEAQARESEERLQVAAQTTQDYAIIVQDTHGHIVTWNRGAERMFGYLEAEVTGELIDTIFLPDDRNIGVAAAERRRARIEGRSKDERWHVRKDGSRLFCGGVTTQIEARNFTGYAKIMLDITDRKVEESAQHLELIHERTVREKVEAANRLKDEFLAVLSHELKHPLNLIQVKAELLARVPEARGLPVVQEAAEAIRHSVAGQATLIDDLLDLSRLRTGKLALHPAATDIAALLRSAAETMQADFTGRGIALDMQGVAEPFTVDADPVRLEQIVWNLVSNALKFTQQGGRISVTLSRDGDSACIEVRDNGQGIDQALLPSIFDMFIQAEGVTSRRRGGLGIGLALVKQLTELHGGRVAVESGGAGMGARFRIWLPASRDVTLLPSVTPDGLHSDPNLLKGKRLLLVDDATDALDALRTLLELEGASVRAESSGAAALRAVGEESFDLIVSDIAMPGMDGYELIAQLRRAAATAQVPAIALSGFGRRQDAMAARQAGFDAHLGKPVSLTTLLQTIGGVMRNRVA
ncbi:CheR family methyltransferase [Paraburkholderia sp.]|uniref:CheR family methyltransferase n=1 Tax=Paraburkholderia sp. TaxID=1926495 RepID=UPI0023A76EC8|nr:CheR family methyltransferase [Paraburkholderia sp.]MDE1182268.1 chemotaxis protein CheB [Paraburkholderia sp.]